MPGDLRVSLRSSLPAYDPDELPVLVLVHGAGMDASVWDAQLAVLAASGIPALAPSFPGHGLSQGTPLERISALASWLLRLTEAIGGKRWTVAGHSMGALVILEAALHAPDRIAGLALIGAALTMPVNPDLMAAAREDLPKAAALISRWGHGAKARADGRAELGRRRLESSAPGVLASDLAACAEYGGPSMPLSRIGCPTVVIAGAEDRMTPPEKSRVLARALPRAEFIEIPEAGHMLMAEAPDAIANVLARIAKMKEPGG